MFYELHKRKGYDGACLGPLWDWLAEKASGLVTETETWVAWESAYLQGTSAEAPNETGVVPWRNSSAWA